MDQANKDSKDVKQSDNSHLNEIANNNVQK